MEIDVSKCEFYNNNYCSCYIDNYGDCYHKCSDEELKDCYYKQLQQLKAENEEIRKVNSANAKLMVRLRDTLDEIKHILEVNKQELDECLFNDIDGQILQKIKEVKGDE